MRALSRENILPERWEHLARGEDAYQEVWTMTFSNENLKRLKEDEFWFENLSKEKWDSLLARLETSQNLNAWARHSKGCSYTKPCHCGYTKAYEAWHKSCGEE